MPRKPPQSDASSANVAVIIVNYRTPKLTLECLAALADERDLIEGLRAIVVDGGSGDDSAAVLGEQLSGAEFRDWVSFMPLQINGGFGWANNQAILTVARDPSPTDFVHLLNPDTQVVRGAVRALVEEMQAHDKCGAAGSQLIDLEGRLSASAFRFPSIGREFVDGAQSETLGKIFGTKSTVVTLDSAAEVDWVTGASVMLRMEALRETGLFDDGFFLYFDEVELMHRLRKRGWGVRHVPESRVLHHEGASTGLGERAARSRLPAYWYQSRRRYFTLTGGRSSAVAAGFGLLVGRFLYTLRTIARRGSKSRSLAPDLFMNGFWPRAADRSASVPRLGEPPGRLPWWMTHR